MTGNVPASSLGMKKLRVVVGAAASGLLLEFDGRRRGAADGTIVPPAAGGGPRRPGRFCRSDQAVCKTLACGDAEALDPGNCGRHPKVLKIGSANYFVRPSLTTRLVYLLVISYMVTVK